MPRRIIIVGPSCSGKTSAAEIVAQILHLPLISMDAFRTTVRRVPVHFEMVRGRQVRNYEHPALWDSHAIACKMRACQGGFVAEGNHLLHYPAIATIPEQERFYIDVPFKVSLERRKTRHRALPADESFRLIGERETMRWVWPQMDIPGVVRIDGTQPIGSVVAEILDPEPYRQLCTLKV